MTIFNFKNNSVYRTYSIHIVSCIAFIFLPLIASPRASFFDSFRIGDPEIQGIISSSLLVLFFYLHYLVLLPGLLYKKKYVHWFFSILVSFCVIIFLPNVLAGKDKYHPHPFENPMERRPEMRHDTKFEPAPPYKPDFHQPFQERHENKTEDFFRTFQIQESLLKFLFILALSFLLKTNRFWKESQEEKRKAELLFLKSQVNPHFLFNTLNGIYALSLEKSETTSESIIKLSELMRYVVGEIEKEYVLLSEEIKYLENYIDLQRLRFGKTVKIHFNVTEFDSDIKISPMLFINFVENAFKYGISAKGVSEIYIGLGINENNLHFTVENQQNSKKIDSNQLQKGLENVTRRLALTYPNRHILKLEEKHNRYHIELIIKNIK